MVNDIPCSFCQATAGENCNPTKIKEDYHSEHQSFHKARWYDSCAATRAANKAIRDKLKSSQVR